MKKYSLDQMPLSYWLQLPKISRGWWRAVAPDTLSAPSFTATRFLFAHRLPRATPAPTRTTLRRFRFESPVTFCIFFLLLL